MSLLLTTVFSDLTFHFRAVQGKLNSDSVPLLLTAVSSDLAFHCRAVESEDATETEALLSAAEQGQAGTGKFFYFSTFVQAALIVHELHLLDVASLRQVR